MTRFGPLTAQPRRRLRDSVLRFEPLELRLSLDAAGPLLGVDARLTLSFAPDDAEVAGQANRLAATFDALAPASQWQEAVLRAFQTWAVHANVDVGVVSDDGSPFGTPGALQRDPRFGDIRIAAIPLAPQIGAISVPITSALSGSWYADVVFNSAFPYRSADDLFAIALHEAGNVFGLPDNDNPDSPLRAGPIPTAVAPTAADIAALQALHGVRAPDLNERQPDGGVQPNDSPGDATPLIFADDDHEEDELLPGAAPLVIYGDVQQANDVDYFRIELPDDYAGPLTVQVRTSGISLLRPTASLTDEAGALLDQATSAVFGGDRLQLRFSEATPGSKYVVRVAAADDGLEATGGYSLTVVLDDRNLVAQAAIDEVADGSLHFIDAPQLRRVFDAGRPNFNEETGANENAGSASALTRAAGFPTGRKLEAYGSVSTLGDVDFYKLKTPDDDASHVLQVAVRSLDRGGLAPGVLVLDADQRPLASRVLVNGAGQVLVEVPGVPADADLFVGIAAADADGPFALGNYALTVSLAVQEAQLASFGSGVLDAPAATAVHTLHVAEPQLMHVVLDAAATTGDRAAAVLQIVDLTGRVRHEFAAPTGQARSASAVLLPQGTYEVRVFAVALPGATYGPIAYAIAGATLSDPFVSEGGDPTLNPFVCPDPALAGFTCYPGGIVSTDPFLWEKFVGQLPEPPPPLPLLEVVTTLLGDWWRWVWETAGASAAPVAMDDAFRFSDASSAPAGELSVLANDVGSEGRPLVAVLTSGPASGVVELAPNGTFRYEPRPGFAGSTLFTYVAYDFQGASLPATVALTLWGTGNGTSDFDADGRIAGGDFLIWQRQFGLARDAAADGTGDALVDESDLALWQHGFGGQPQAPLSGANLVGLDLAESAAPAYAPAIFSGGSWSISSDASTVRAHDPAGRRSAWQPLPPTKRTPPATVASESGGARSTPARSAAAARDAAFADGLFATSGDSQGPALRAATALRRALSAEALRVESA